MTSTQLRELADLVDRRAQLDALIEAAVNGNLTPQKPAAEPKFSTPMPKRRRMSAEARKRISLAARRRWKDAKIAGRNRL